MVINKKQLCDMFSISAKTANQWLALGCPTLKTGGRGRGNTTEFNAKEVILWRQQCAIDEIGVNSAGEMGIEEAKRRKLVAEAGIAELELAKEKGKVVDLPQLERNLSHRFALMNSRLRKVPERCVMQIVGETDEVRIKRIILSEIDEVLEAISNTHFLNDIDDAEESDEGEGDTNE